MQPIPIGTGLNKNTPYVLLGSVIFSLKHGNRKLMQFIPRYLHFASLFLLLLLCVSLLVLFLYTLKTDVQQRLSALTLELRSEILGCAKAYVDNNCDAATRIPMSEKACLAWEACMERDVVVVGKARVVAEILAEVINGFVDVISIKTMVSSPLCLLAQRTDVFVMRSCLSLFLSSRQSTPRRWRYPSSRPVQHHHRSSHLHSNTHHHSSISVITIRLIRLRDCQGTATFPHQDHTIKEGAGERGSRLGVLLRRRRRERERTERRRAGSLDWNDLALF